MWRMFVRVHFCIFRRTIAMRGMKRRWYLSEVDTIVTIVGRPITNWSVLVVDNEISSPMLKWRRR